jgi:hypothetical protein
MPSENSVNLANLQRKNLPHIASALSLLQPTQILNGLFKFKHKEQAYNLPCSHRYHQIQPVTTVVGSAFTSTNYYFDFNLPMNVDMIDEEVLVINLENTSQMTPWVADASVPFWFQRIEVRVDGEIKQTIRDIQMYLENTMYLDDFEREKNAPMIGIDKMTYKADPNLLSIGATKRKTFRLRLNTFIAKCNLNLRSIRGQIVIRCYPQSISTFSTSQANSSIQLVNPTLLVRECELTQDGRNKLTMIHKENVDYRFLNVVHEDPTVNTTSGSTLNYVTKNFDNTVYSHVVVLSRPGNPTLGSLEMFLEQEKVYLENQSSASLSNGIQWTSDDLKLVVYQSHFPNAMTQASNSNIYIPLVASLNPVEANKKGVQNGWDVLPENSKVCILPLTNGSVKLDILCYEYKHVRVEGGKINLF